MVNYTRIFLAFNVLSTCRPVKVLEREASESTIPILNMYLADLIKIISKVSPEIFHCKLILIF